MADLVPRIIVMALGAGVLGGADALRLLLEFAGRRPLLDIGISIFLIGMVTSPVLGNMLLARFVRKPRSEAGTGAGAYGGTPGASATDCFAQVTLLVSLGVAFLATAFHLVVPFVAHGGLRALFPAFTSMSVVVAAVAMVAGTTLLVRFSRRARAAPTPATDTGRLMKPTLVTSLAVVVFALASLVLVPGAHVPPGRESDGAICPSV